MPTYKITDPDSGKVMRVTGDSPPSEAELNQIFSSVRGEAPKEENTIKRSMGQRVAGAVAPYARPVLEYGGAVGGGMAGTGAGPLGSVAGAGLGYAGGRQAANALEEYAGMKPNSTLPQAAMSAAQDIPAGADMEAGGQVIGKGLEAAGPYLRKAAERTYGSATKMPLSKKWVQALPGREMSNRQMAVKAGLESEVPPSEYGLAKAKKLEQEMRGAVDDILSGAAKQGRASSTEDVLKYGLPKAYARAAKSSDPVGAKQLVDELATKFKEHGPTIPVDKLNAIKRQLYDEVKWGGQQVTGLPGQITEDVKKGVAHEIMTRLEKQFPQIAGLNKQDAAYINLIEAIERTVGREQNKDLIGLGAKVLSVKNLPAAVFEQTIGHPQVKARIAFLLNRASKNQGAPLLSRGLMYGASKLPAPDFGPQSAEAGTLADYARGGDNPRARAIREAADTPQSNSYAIPQATTASVPRGTEQRAPMNREQYAAETERLRQEFERRRNDFNGSKAAPKKRISVKRVTIHGKDGDELKYMDDKGKLYDEDPND